MDLNEATKILESNGYIVENIFNTIANKISGKPVIANINVSLKFEDEYAEKLYNAIVNASKEIGLKVIVNKNNHSAITVYNSEKKVVARMHIDPNKTDLMWREDPDDYSSTRNYSSTKVTSDEDVERIAQKYKETVAE